MEIKLEHVLLLFYFVILFYFANNVEGVYDPTCNHDSRNDAWAFLCTANPNCVYHPPNTGNAFTDIYTDGRCESKDPP